MVAIEIDKILNNSQVILLGSAVVADEINSVLLKLSLLTDCTPIKFIQLLTGKSDVNLLKMFTESDSRFIKAMCKIIKDWGGFLGDRDNLLRIHGSRDLVITCPKDCLRIEKAGHLIAMTHALECQALLNQRIMIS
ncbi:hypothetical protein PQO03_02110 [Lentisphaera profundi]|uniref:Uncharacterized protein n=1 Tax=Lentisphaera profundi TaxID=1658616 RepID=A0ABY7VRC0_9BACT|nr:hypothetical protein [Lentisphaera profundi]WDE96753.1 hypothetical protein PQO03_02110 [Lentisphaera profundi]